MDSSFIDGLAKSIFYPPSWLFGVMWSIIYTLIAVGVFILLNKSSFNKVKWLYIINGVLNILWLFTFFGLQSLFLSVIIFAVLIIFAYLLIAALKDINKTAYYLTLPYFIWLVFAFMLNYSLYMLN
jgi:tryptophan-rich sensory protein